MFVAAALVRCPVPWCTDWVRPRPDGEVPPCPAHPGITGRCADCGEPGVGAWERCSVCEARRREEDEAAEAEDTANYYEEDDW